MASPFALAVGGYLLIFLSIYATSCPPYLQVQRSMATASWIDLSNRIEPISRDGVDDSLCDVLTSATMVYHFFCPRRMAAATRQRVWDPGIRAGTIGFPDDLFHCPHHLVLSPNGWPFLPSICHYSHPVLSRRIMLTVMTACRTPIV